MAKKRIVIHLTVAEYETAKRRESAASHTPFKYNTATKALTVDMDKLRENIKTAAKSKRVCRESEKAFTVNDL